MLKGSRQQTAAGGKQAGILPEEPDEDEARGEGDEEEAEGSEAAEHEREQAAGSYVASLLQQTSLEDQPGRTMAPARLAAADLGSVSWMVCLAYSMLRLSESMLQASLWAIYCLGPSLVMLILPDGPRPLPSPSACYYCVAGCVCGHGVQGHKAGLLHYAAPDYVLDKKP